MAFPRSRSATVAPDFQALAWTWLSKAADQGNEEAGQLVQKRHSFASCCLKHMLVRNISSQSLSGEHQISGHQLHLVPKTFVHFAFTRALMQDHAGGGKRAKRQIYIYIYV